MLRLESARASNLAWPKPDLEAPVDLDRLVFLETARRVPSEDMLRILVFEAAHAGSAEDLAVDLSVDFSFAAGSFAAVASETWFSWVLVVHYSPCLSRPRLGVRFLGVCRSRPSQGRSAGLR